MVIAFSAFLFFLAVGMPVVFVLGISGAIAVIVTTDVPIVIVSQRIFSGLNLFTIMAIPFFVFAGAIMDVGGISRRIIDFSMALIGWITGSLLLVSVVAAMGLAAISGSGSADTAAVSSIMQPEFKRRRYNVDFAAGIIASAGSLAQIIPPSLLMIVVAMITSQSTGALFLSGVIPGFIAGLLLLLVCYLHAVRGGPQYRDVEPFTLGRLAKTFVAAIPAGGMPVIIVGGIIGGFFTATEAAAVAGTYSVIISWLIYRELTVQKLRTAIIRTISLSAAVMMIIGTANVFGWLIAESQVGGLLGNWMRSVTDNPYVFLLMVNVFLVFVGMFMESIAAVLILLPILMPIALDYGIHPIHFGLMVVFNFAVGMITPPYGITLFVASSIAERSLVQVARRLGPALAVMLGVLLLCTYVADTSLFLPRLFGFIN
ncbi:MULTISPECIES: TRAP transporter large permease [unclassified Aurantimonas]|uniref:TRAP transporter large permease n=1 Tax=unclassified Aurantimonas TaxID=2638230 RepID=UPI002E19C417|nr:MULTISPECIES: TRAP transporter large permease [unclassified Aurantimonas]MEC5293482.1 TRAP transporter large permease [Aurantimonas sp. C2-3-R2]MEC5414553.1 TRAP transporter large permease [Aurantimonas sp. C2-4-R8]